MTRDEINSEINRLDAKFCKLVDISEYYRAKATSIGKRADQVIEEIAQLRAMLAKLDAEGK